MNTFIRRESLFLAFLTLAILSSAGCSDEAADPARGQGAEPTTYKVSTQEEFDSVKSLVFDGGDRILFERGREFAGHFSLRRSDLRPELAITVADFGAASSTRPVIRADVEGMGTLDIRDSGGWHIENLEITNQSDQFSERHGIFVAAEDSGTHRDFVIRNCLIRDVTGKQDYYNNGGITFRVTGSAIPTRFDGVLIENNEIRDIGGVGIRTKSTWEADPDDPRGVGKPIGRHAHLNLVVRGNRVSNFSRNAIIVGSADAPLAEYNVMGPKLRNDITGNTFYNYATDDAMVQYNEAFGNIGPASDKDRGGFDVDYNSRNTTFRYNYSHDNNFAFAIMRKFGEGIYIHHNISVNERYGFMHYGFYADHAISDVIVSNNTFYSSHPDMMMFMNFGPLREPIDTTYVDNIFVFAGAGATWGSLPTKERGNLFENNLVVGLEHPDYVTLAEDPRLVSPAESGTAIDMKNPDRLEGFRLCNGSPAIGSGRNNDIQADYDFWNEAIVGENIGAYGGKGIDCKE